MDRVVLQSEQQECGLACLAMVLSHHGQDYDLRSLRGLAHSAQNGLSLGQILSLAQQCQLVGRGVRLELEQVRDLRRPAILHWGMDHFVVLNRVRRKGVEISDPGRGRYFAPWSEVDARFTGVALELWPGAEFRSGTFKHQGLNLRRMWSLVRGSLPIGWLVGLSIALQGLILLGPWHMQWVVDEALAAGDTHLIWVLALGFGLLLLMRVAVQWVRALLVNKVGHSVAFRFASKLLQHLLHLPLVWFTRYNAGDVAARFGSLSPIRDFFIQGAAAILVDSVIVILSLLAMLIYAPVLAIVVLLPQCVHVLIYLLNFPRLRALTMGTVVAQGAEQSHLIETLRGIHSIKVYAAEGARQDRWQQLHARTLGQSYQLQHRHAILQAVTHTLSGIELAGVITLGALTVLDEPGFTLGMLFAFLSYRGHFSERLQAWVLQWTELRTLRAHLDRVGDILLAAAEPTQASRALAYPPAIRLDQISFRYTPDGSDVLRNLTLDIAPGAYVAIVGPSGSGKSTLLRLILGLQMPDQGHIYADGHLLRNEHAASLRLAAGCVLQEDTLFSGSVQDNIVMTAQPDEQRVWQVLHDVGLFHDIAALPMGVRTVLGDIDSQFSSGQRQRLLLARALYREPQLLVLDEGTANLDPESAAHIFSVLEQLTCTRVVVTHDMNFAKRAQRIYELRGGELRPLADAWAKTG